MKIVFRADGNAVSGLGHIMRSVALMGLLKQSFACEFWTANPEFFPKEDFPDTVIYMCNYSSLADEANALIIQLPRNSLVVLDGYHFDTAYQHFLKAAGLKVVCIDDIINYEFVADVVINHAGGITPEMYLSKPYTKLFLGPEFAIVNPLFYSRKVNRLLSNDKLLVNLGGADPENATAKVLEQLSRLRCFSEIHVILGAANQHAASLMERCKEEGFITFYRSLSTDAVYKLMQLCTYAVLPPSTICYEYMSVGGIVFLYQIADNQERIKKYFLETKLAFRYQDIEIITQEEKHKAIELQSQVFDGQSGLRLVSIFRELAQMN